ncbi:uncharacterized protein LOC107271762 [Cephus cinctus]|uniref:Uncharacterized protein LOC107271762 n=1 Tax=Cephus cinctus TaxID=211228 RepID=A0AAJ7C8I5_CEPCN|nr:uncharacterized protein LOC107271762 [Cephus cinctus]
MEQEVQDTCYSAGSIAGAVLGTFFTTLLLLVLTGLLYRQWRRHKGKHLVLVTDPEIVEDAYAFDNPCFKDATPAAVRSLDRTVSSSPAETPVKDSTRWSTPWSSLGIGSPGNRTDKRRTLDDSCLGPKATRVSVVSLRSRDFTGLGFNVCGNMREGIFVKDLLHRGPASESGRIHPGDRIASVKISFRSMVYEDALTILSYASPYDVELEVESGGGPGSKPTTLLKKSIGPSPTRICHPLYRSQSIPELSQGHKSSAKRLFIADPNESLGSNYSTMNSTLKSSKSTPGNQTLERRHEEVKNNHHKFGIKVLPALDGTVHRIENENEHNTNLERRNSRKLDAEKYLVGTRSSGHQDDSSLISGTNVVPFAHEKKTTESVQTRESAPLKRESIDTNGIDVTDRVNVTEAGSIPTEVPAEVHNAAMAARCNRKNSAELLSKKSPSEHDAEDPKSPQKNKRKAPAPPKTMLSASDISPGKKERMEADDKIDSIADYTESLNDYVNKVRETTDGAEARRQRLENQAATCRRNSESDTDSELQNSFTTIELNPADITIHHTPVPEVDDDLYRKAASLGDLSKYESRTSTTLERAQSLDMTDTGSKKRKAPLPPEDINESTEDLTKLDQMDTFERRKLKKSNEWGTLEDAIWTKAEPEEKKPKIRKKSNGTLERSKSAVEIQLKEEFTIPTTTTDRINLSDEDVDSSIELYNLPLSKQLTRDLIESERMFNPDQDNSLARIVNNGSVMKSPTVEEIELDFRQAKPLSDAEDDIGKDENKERISANEEFGRALRFFDLHTRPTSTNKNLDSSAMYEGKKEVVEEPITKVIIDKHCPYCEHRAHGEQCKHNTQEAVRESPEVIVRKIETHQQAPNMKMPERESLSTFQAHRTKFENRNLSAQTKSPSDSPAAFETHFAKRILNVADDKNEDAYDFGTSVTVNKKNPFVANEDRNNISNISNVSVSSGENSEDSGVVRGVDETLTHSSRPPLPETPMPLSSTPHKMTYITEIKVSTSRENIHEPESENEEIVAIMEGTNENRKPEEPVVTSNGKPMPGKKPPIPPRRSDITKSTTVTNEDAADKQVLYVSEYKSVPDVGTSEVKQPGAISKKFEQWVFLGENKDNPWGNGSSQPQPVTSIVLSSSNDDKIVQHQ